MTALTLLLLRPADFTALTGVLDPAPLLAATLERLRDWTGAALTGFGATVFFFAAALVDFVSSFAGLLALLDLEWEAILCLDYFAGERDGLLGGTTAWAATALRPLVLDTDGDLLVDLAVFFTCFPLCISSFVK